MCWAIFQHPVKIHNFIFCPELDYEEYYKGISIFLGLSIFALHFKNHKHDCRRNRFGNYAREYLDKQTRSSPSNMALRTFYFIL
jgi:hypothetical protein